METPEETPDGSLPVAAEEEDEAVVVPALKQRTHPHKLRVAFNVQPVPAYASDNALVHVPVTLAVDRALTQMSLAAPWPLADTTGNPYQLATVSAWALSYQLNLWALLSTLEAAALAALYDGSAHNRTALEQVFQGTLTAVANLPNGEQVYGFSLEELVHTAMLDYNNALSGNPPWPSTTPMLPTPWFLQAAYKGNNTGDSSSLVLRTRDRLAARARLPPPVPLQRPSSKAPSMAPPATPPPGATPLADTTPLLTSESTPGSRTRRLSPSSAPVPSAKRRSPDRQALS